MEAAALKVAELAAAVAALLALGRVQAALLVALVRQINRSTKPSPRKT